MKPREALDIKHRAMAQLAQAFTNPVRLMILTLLCQGEASVEFLAEKIGQSKANASAQLKVLFKANLLKMRKEGRFTYYEVASPTVIRLFRTLEETAAEDFPEMRELTRSYFNNAGEESKLTPELLAQVKEGKALLIDVRPEEEFNQGHLPGAISFPLPRLKAEGARLPKDKPLYVYCRGKYCVTAVEAIKRLKESGIEAANLFADANELHYAL